MTLQSFEEAKASVLKEKRGLALESIKAYIGPHSSEDHSCENNHDSFTFVYKCEHTSGYKISSDKWKLLMATMGFKESFDYGKVQDDPKLLIIYAILAEWYNLYISKAITLDECMVGMYSEFSTLSQKTVQKKEEKKSTKEQLKDRAREEIIAFLEVDSNVAIDTTAMFDGDYLIVTTNGHDRYIFWSLTWDHLEDNILKKQVYKRGCVNPKKDAVLDILDHWRDKYVQNEISLDECMIGMYEQFTHLNDVKVAEPEEEPKVEEPAKLEPTEEELKQKAHDEIVKYLNRSHIHNHDTNFGPCKDYIFVTKALTSTGYNFWDFIWTNLKDIINRRGYHSDMITSNEKTIFIMNILNTWRDRFILGQITLDECMRGMYEQYCHINDVKEGPAKPVEEPKAEEPAKSEEEELKDQALEAIVKYLNDPNIVYRDTIVPNEWDYVFLTWYTGSHAIWSYVWDNLKTIIGRKLPEGILCGVYDRKSDDILDILRDWRNRYLNGTVDLDECMRGMYKQYIRLNDVKGKEPEKPKEPAKSDQKPLMIQPLLTQKGFDGMFEFLQQHLEPDTLAKLDRFVPLVDRIKHFQKLYPNENVLAQFVDYDDIGKLVTEDDRSLDLVAEVLKDMLPSFEFPDTIVARCCQAAAMLDNTKVTSFMIKTVKQLPSRYHQYMKYFLEEDVRVKDIRFCKSPVLKGLLFGFDNELNEYDVHRLYLVDQGRLDPYNAYMGYPMEGEDIEECEQAIKQQYKNISGTAYGEMVKNQPWYIE